MKPLNNFSEIKIEPLNETDCIEELTSLLHLSYKNLAFQGLKYLASHQPSSVTKQRIEKGTCYVAKHNHKIIGTITYYSPSNCKGCELYDKPAVASYGQFAVHPDFQKKGIGKALIEIAENLAKKDNAEEIAIDTAESAYELIKFYTSLGYKPAGHTRWNEVNYKSLLLSKTISA